MSSRADSGVAELKFRRVWLALGWLLVFAVIYASLAPVDVEVKVGHGDKLVHALAYGCLMGWFSSIFLGHWRRRWLATAFIALGIALEFLQGNTEYRTFDLFDMAANAAGVVLGWLLAPPRLPNVIQLAEKLLRLGVPD